MSRIAPTCDGCGCLIGNRDTHAGRCRKRAAPIPDGNCPISTAIRDGKGYPRSVPCQLDSSHELHQADFEGFRYRWYVPELVDEGMAVEIDDDGTYRIMG